MKVIDLQPCGDGVWRPARPWWRLSKIEMLAAGVAIFGTPYIADAIHAIQAFLSAS